MVDSFGLGGSDSFDFGGGGMGFTDLSNPLMCGALHDDSVDMDSQSPYIPSSIRLISPGEWQKRKAEVPYF